MIKKYFLNLVDLFFNLIQGTILEGNNEKESQLRRWLFVATFVIALFSIYYFGNKLFLINFALFFDMTYEWAPIWAPILLGTIFAKSWMRYIRADYVLNTETMLLEIKIPKETLKSPLAMEIFFTSLYQTGAATFKELYWYGKVRAWFSLELVSLGGQVKFFIWTQKKFRNLIEAQLYAQYPNIAIQEAEDYMSSVPHEPDPVNLPMWATYFKFIKSNVYPIKTYVDYGLNEDPKEEFKIDPMTSVIEYLGSLHKGEETWIQIIIQAHRKISFRNDAVFFPKGDWKESARHEIEKIREESIVKTKKDTEFPCMPNPTKGQQNTI